MNTGPLKKHLKQLFVYTNMDYHIMYANIHALMAAITLLLTWIVWTWVTFQIMKITWLPPVMKKYQEWKKYHTDIELWFAWTSSFLVIIYLTYPPLRRNPECLYYLNTLQALAELYCSYLGILVIFAHIIIIIIIIIIPLYSVVHTVKTFPCKIFLMWHAKI